MADVKWIKITTNMFDNRKIRHLRHLPGGNDIVLIWVMLLTMAGRCNSGGKIFLTENIPYTTKMLADELDFEENTVKLALEALERFKMIVRDKDFFSIAGWEEYQNIEGMERIKAQTRKRVAEHRARKKQELIAGEERYSNVTVTQSNATDKEKDIEKDIDNQSIYRQGNEKTQKRLIDRLIDDSTFTDIKDQIDYDILCDTFNKDELDLAVRCIAEMYTTSKPLEINDNTYSPEFVRNRSLSITSEHIEYVFDCFNEHREKVANIKGYLFTSIFNAPDTMGAYYANCVRADG